MQVTVNTIDLSTNKPLNLSYDEADICPMCHSGICGKYIASAMWKKSRFYAAAVLKFCTICNNIFLNVYDCSPESKHPNEISYTTGHLISSTPSSLKKKEFDKKLLEISPNFDIIYNQSMQAEANNLDQIAGIGYRKSIEFLVKDFAIYARPDEADKIKNMPLGNCIKEHIDDPRIQVLAEKSVWIGNDETHYVRKHENKDISDMKKFIDALVYFISMVLITEEAEALQKP